MVHLHRVCHQLLWVFVFSVTAPNIQLIPFPVGSFSQISALVALCFALLFILKRKKLRSPHLFHFLVLVFVAWGLTTSFWSINQADTLYRFVVNLEVLILIWLIWEFAQTDKDIISILRAFLIGGLLSAINIFYNFLSGISYRPWTPNRFSAFGYDPNDIAVMIALGIPIAWYLYSKGAITTKRSLPLLYIPVASLAIILTGSRTGFIAGVLGVIVILIHLLLNSRHRFLAIVSFGVIFALIVFNAPEESLSHLRAGVESAAQLDFTGRTNIWRAGLSVFNTNPLLGIGAGAFGTAVEPLLGRYQTAHNVFASVLVEQGLFGIGLFVSILAVVGSAAVRSSPSYRWLLLALLGIWFIGAMTLGWEYRKPTWFVFSIIIAFDGFRDLLPRNGEVSKWQRVIGPEG